jgi:hypothetical protein
MQSFFVFPNGLLIFAQNREKQLETESIRKCFFLQRGNQYKKTIIVHLISKVLNLLGWGVEGSWVRGGRGLSEDSGIKCYNLEIKHIDKWLAYWLAGFLFSNAESWFLELGLKN